MTPLTGAQLRTLNTGLLSGYAMNETLFYQLLNMKKSQRESQRDWMVLRTFDNTIVFTASDDYQSTKTLPSRFSRIYEPYDANQGGIQPGVYLVESSGARVPLSPISFANRFAYKDVPGYYYLDLKNGKIGRTGSVAGTLHLFFIEESAEVTAETGWTGFPFYAGPLLAYDVAIEHKGGIDWDTVNANQVGFNAGTVSKIERDLALWDARLQQNELGV